MTGFRPSKGKIKFLRGKSPEELVCLLNEMQKPYVIINIGFAEGRYIAWYEMSEEDGVEKVAPAPVTSKAPAPAAPKVEPVASAVPASAAASRVEPMRKGPKAKQK